jgi:hypothetical protein
MKFIDLDDAISDVAAGTRSRALAAGIAPDDYDEVTSSITSLRSWPDAFIDSGNRHLAAARAAEAADGADAAATEFASAAAAFHIATCVPHPDRRGHHEAASAMRDALRLTDPSATYLSGELFVGVLRRPAGSKTAPLVVVIPGLDSSKEEFGYLCDVLLQHGLATMAIDGPGQGELAEAMPAHANYCAVITEVLDVVDTLRTDVWSPSTVGVAALSLGGFYGATALAHDRRLTAGLIVSGPFSFDWDHLPLPVTDILELRVGNRTAASRFADDINLATIEPLITQPLFIVTGGADNIPGVTPAATLVDQTPNRTHLFIEDGDHLLANSHPRWLPQAAQWLTTQLNPTTGH